MDMPLHVVVSTAGLRATTHCPAAALRRDKPAYIDMRAGDLVETLMQNVLHALARANRLDSEFTAGFDSHSVQLVPTASTHTIALDRGGSRRLWQYFATEIMEGIEVKLQLQLTPPPPRHARGHEVETTAQKAASAKAAAQTAKERARRLAKIPHPPTERRTATGPVGPARVDRVDTVAARVVNQVQVEEEARQRFDAERVAGEKKIEEAMAALDKVNEKRVELEQKNLTKFAHKPPTGGPRRVKSGRDLAANVKKKHVVAGFVPMQKGRLDKEQEEVVALTKATKAAATFSAAIKKEDDVRPPAVHKKLGFAGLSKDLRPKKHKSRVKVESRKNADLSKEGAKVLTTEERLQRQSDQISYVLNKMISGKRKLYGTMMRDARSAFEAIDKDGSGSLDYFEFSAFLKRLGLGLKQEQTMELAKAMDADNSGEIDCDEFVAALEAAQKRAKEEAEREKQALEAENEAIRAAVTAQRQQQGQDSEAGGNPKQELSEVERMRARIARTKLNRENYSYQLTGPNSPTQAAGFPAAPVLTKSSMSPSAKMRVTLPGTHGVTVAIDLSEPEPEPEPEPELEQAAGADGHDSMMSSGIANFTAADYVEAIDEMEPNELSDACAHWDIEAGDVEEMREKLRQHYVAMHRPGSGSGDALEVSEENSAWEVDEYDEDDGSVAQMREAVAAADLAAPAEVPVEEVSAMVAAEDTPRKPSEEEVVKAVADMYSNMDVERQEAAVAAALQQVDVVEEDGADDIDDDDEEDADADADADADDDIGSNDVGNGAVEDGTDRTDDVDDADSAAEEDSDEAVGPEEEEEEEEEEEAEDEQEDNDDDDEVESEDDVATDDEPEPEPEQS